MHSLMVVWILFGALLLPGDYCRAESSLQLNLQEAIVMAGKSAHSMGSLRKYDVEEAVQDVNEIFGTFYSPRFALESYGGLVPEARGDITTTTDTNDSHDHLGPFFTIDLKVIQPIYSFGKYSRAKEAGESNLTVKKELFRDAKNDLALDVVKAYLGTVAGRAGIKVGEELQDRYRQLVRDLEKSVERVNLDFDDSDLLEAKSLRYEIEKQLADIESETEQALIYLRGLLSLDREDEIAVQAADTPVLTGEAELVAGLQRYFRENSPLIKSLDAGLNALQKNADLEKHKQYPDLFLALGAGYGSADNRDKQENAFVQDDYNYERLGGVLGLKWDFNYHVNGARVEKALIKYRQLAEKRELALLTADGSIEKLCGEAARKQKLLETAESSMKSAKTWLAIESDHQDLGIGDLKRLVRAYQQYFQLKGEIIAAGHRYLVTLAELAHVAGNTDLFVGWTDNGKVQL